MALNPEELDLDSAAMQAKYDETMREQQSQLAKEDLSDMVAEHAAKQKVIIPYIQSFHFIESFSNLADESSTLQNLKRALVAE